MPLVSSIVHQLSLRPFSNTSRETSNEQGNTISNSFTDPRNIANTNDGEITKEGNYLNRYPTNIASNSAGFSITDDAGNDRKLFYGSATYGMDNLTVHADKNGNQQMIGRGSGSASGSSSDYLYSNPYYASMLNPITRQEQVDIMEPKYSTLQYQKAQNVSNIQGKGTNAPSSSDSWAGYSMNNPFAFTSNFSGGGLGTASGGSSSDYYSSDPYRISEMQKEDLPVTFKGGKVDFKDLIIKNKNKNKNTNKKSNKTDDVVNDVNDVNDMEGCGKITKTLQKLNSLRNKITKNNILDSYKMLL